MEVWVKRGRGGGSITLVQFLQKKYFNFAIFCVFGRFCFPPFLLAKSNVYYRFHNLQKSGGVRPLMAELCHFFLEGFLQLELL